jgi:hypothetical protein
MPLWPSSRLAIRFIKLIVWHRVGRSRGLPQSESSSSSTIGAKRHRPPEPSMSVLRWGWVGENGVPRCGVTRRAWWSACLRRKGHRRRGNVARSSSPGMRMMGGAHVSAPVFPAWTRWAAYWASPSSCRKFVSLLFFFIDLCIDSKMSISWLVDSNHVVPILLSSW